MPSRKAIHSQESDCGELAVHARSLSAISSAQAVSEKGVSLAVDLAGRL